MGFAIPPAPGARFKPILASALFLLAWNPAFFSYAQDRRTPSCQTTIGYRIGTLDQRFGITAEEFRHAIEDASNVWATDRKLFKYDPRGKLRIDLVYDTRQEITQRVNTVRAGISAKMKEADLIEDRIVPLRDDLGTLDNLYSDQLASYQRAQDRYNQEVNLGTPTQVPEAVFQSLAKERQALRKQQRVLEEKRQTLSRSVDELNELIKKHNTLLTQAQAEAIALNNSGSTSVQFEQGRYVREAGEEWIDIFQFESKPGLLVILAHELGHALGIKHNANPSSIMSPLIHTDRLALTAEDADGLRAVCSQR